MAATPADVVAVGNVLVKFIRHLLGGDDALVNTYPNRDYAVVGRALDSLRFQENGTLGILRAFVAGQPMPADSERRVQEFFFFETEAALELRRLSNRFAEAENYSIRQRHALEMAFDYKKNIRNAVAVVARDLVQGRRLHSKESVTELVHEIEKLNDVLMSLEDSLRIYVKK